MSITALHPSAEYFVQAMHLTPESQQIVRNCISRYSADPQTCCEIIQYIFFGIMEGIKSLFGTSEWQRASHLIKSRALEMVSPSIQSPVDERVIRAISLEDEVENLMQLCLFANDPEATSPEGIRFIDLENYVAHCRAYQRRIV